MIPHLGTETTPKALFHTHAPSQSPPIEINRQAIIIEPRESPVITALQIISRPREEEEGINLPGSSSSRRVAKFFSPSATTCRANFGLEAGAAPAAVQAGRLHSRLLARPSMFYLRARRDVNARLSWLKEKKNEILGQVV